MLCMISLRCGGKSIICDYFDLVFCFIRSEETVDTEMAHQNTNFHFEITKYLLLNFIICWSPSYFLWIL